MIAVLWSYSQQAFHVEPLTETCDAGLRAFLQNSPVDYIVIAVCQNHDVANILLARLNKANTKAK